MSKLSKISNRNEAALQPTGTPNFIKEIETVYNQN